MDWIALRQLAATLILPPAGLVLLALLLAMTVFPDIVLWLPRSLR